QLANRAVQEKNVGLALELLDVLKPAKDDDDLRGFEWYHMLQRCGAKPVVVPHAHEGPILAVAVGPDGGMVATGSAVRPNQNQEASFDIRLWDAENARPRGKLPGHPKTINSLGFHPTGKHLVSASDDGTIKVWN